MTQAPKGGRCSGKNRHRGGSCLNTGYHFEDGKYYCDHHIPKVDAFWRDRKAKLSKISRLRSKFTRRIVAERDKALKAADIPCSRCGFARKDHAPARMVVGEQTRELVPYCWKRDKWDPKDKKWTSTFKVVNEYSDRYEEDYNEKWKVLQRPELEKAIKAIEDERDAAVEALTKELFPNGWQEET